MFLLRTFNNRGAVCGLSPGQQPHARSERPGPCAPPPICTCMSACICATQENLTRIVVHAKPLGAISLVDSLRGLRTAGSTRTAAMQRALPGVQLAINWLLAALAVASFPLIRLVESGALPAAAGAGAGGPFSSLWGSGAVGVEAILFGALTGAVVMPLIIIDDLADPDDGACSSTRSFLFRFSTAQIDHAAVVDGRGRGNDHTKECSLTDLISLRRLMAFFACPCGLVSVAPSRSLQCDWRKGGAQGGAEGTSAVDARCCCCTMTRMMLGR